MKCYCSVVLTDMKELLIFLQSQNWIYESTAKQEGFEKIS